MRELEFLPEWYPVLRRRRQRTVVHAWVTAVVLLALTGWSISASQTLDIRIKEDAALGAQLSEVRSELKMLEQQLQLRHQLDQQGRLLHRVGLQVDTTRLLGELDSLMGREMFLLSLHTDTQETRPSSENADGTQPKPDNAQVSRRLIVRLVGVAPSDVHIANLLANLAGRPQFEDVRMSYARDRLSGQHLMREFEISFSIDVNRPIAQ
jgi:hypothetical protein